MIGSGGKFAGLTLSAIVATTIAVATLSGADGKSEEYSSSSRTPNASATKAATRFADEKNVSFRCGVVNESHEVRITATNSDNTVYLCMADCLYEDSNGVSGTLSNKQDVPANTKDFLFAQLRDQEVTYKVVNDGFGTCD